MPNQNCLFAGDLVGDFVTAGRPVGAGTGAKVRLGVAFSAMGTDRLSFNLIRFTDEAVKESVFFLTKTHHR